MNLVFLYILFVQVALLYNFVFTNPCEITNGDSSKSARIEFNENTSINTTLFRLPFEGDEYDIEQITFTSSELNDSQLNQYFRLKFNKLILNSHYDLDKTELDFIELLFSCTSKSKNKPNSKFRNTFLLYITINDVNDKPPEFIGTPYKFSIKELTPIGTIIYQNIKAIDRDMANKPNSQISFSIQKGPFSDYFEFPLTTKSEIAVSKLIQYDIFSKYNLTIIAQDHGIPQLSSNTTIEITVIDIDDKDPVFTKNFYKGFVIRNNHPGSIVNMTSDKIFAFDQDFGINTPIKYSLNTNPDDLFEINSKTGDINLKHSIIDYDKFEYNLVVKATQIDNPLRSAMSMVSINVIDLNLFPPKFDSNFYEASIYENAKLEALVCETRATDRDKNRIEYSIKNNHESPFIIDKYKGIIKVNGRLDYEMKSKYEIEILAKDGNFTDRALVKMNILNLIDKAPNFEYNYYNFKIKIPYDVYIGQIKATDVENTGNMTYKVKFNDIKDSKLFCITQTGTIYICSSIISPVSLDSKQPNAPSSLDDILAQFTQDEYKFNVSVSIYSDDLNIELENSVECKIQIESKKPINLNNKNVEVLNQTKPSIQQPLQPIVFFKDHLFKDLTNVNFFILVIGIVLALLIICFALLIWFKCKKESNKDKQRQKYLKNNIKRTISNRLDFGLFTKNDNGSKKLTNLNSSASSSRASSDRGGVCCSSSKNSTSGISCSSGCSSNFKSSEMNFTDNLKDQQICYINWPEKNADLYSTNKYLNDNSPISKITMLSDYLNQDGHLVKSINLTNKINAKPKNEHEQIRVSCYSDLLSSAASTLKNRETPILIKQDYVYDIGSSPTTNTIHIPICIDSNSDYFQISNQDISKSKLINKNENEQTHCSFKLSSPSTINETAECFAPINKYSQKCLDCKSNYSNSLLETTTTIIRHQQQMDNSPKLLTFLPPNTIHRNHTTNEFILNDGFTNLVFNQHEPLGVNSETNIENNEIIRSDKQSIYEDVKNLNTINRTTNSSKFQDDLNNCNESLARLVNIINTNVNNKTNNLHETAIDSSLISVSIDNFTNEEYDDFTYDYNSNDLTSTNDEERDKSSSSFLSNLTPLTNVSSSFRSTGSSSSNKNINIKIPMNRDVYKICFSNDKNLSDVSYASSAQNEDIGFNKIYHDISANEKTAYV